MTSNDVYGFVVSPDAAEMGMRKLMNDHRHVCVHRQGALTTASPLTVTRVTIDSDH